MDKDTLRQLTRRLEEKKDLNINLLAALQAGIAEVAAVTPRGCLLHTNGMWQLSAEDVPTALALYARIPEDATMLSLQQTEWIELIEPRFRPRCVEVYHNVWYAEQEIELPDTGAEVRTVTAEDAPALAQYYHLPGTPVDNPAETAEYLRQRAAEGVLFGVYFDGVLAGFVGTHDEGSIGILTVAPAFRRRGLGTYLERLAIQKALERGHIPFGQVTPGNAASLALQRSLGMTVSRERICWMDR